VAAQGAPSKAPATTGPAIQPAVPGGPPAPVPIQGSAAGQVFDGNTSLTTHPETRQYKQNPDGTVSRKDGKPMGGSFQTTGSMDEIGPDGKPTGRKSVQGAGGGNFTYQDGKIVDYSDPMTAQADVLAQAAGYKDRHDYLAQSQGQQSGGAVMRAAGGYVPQKSEAELGNERRFGIDKSIQDMQDRVWMHPTRAGANALERLMAVKAGQTEAAGRNAADVYGHELNAGVGHERNAIEAAQGQAQESNAVQRAAMGQGKEQLDRQIAAAAQAWQDEPDNSPKKSKLLERYKQLAGIAGPKAGGGGFHTIDDPNWQRPVDKDGKPDMMAEPPQIQVRVNDQGKMERIAMEGQAKPSLEAFKAETLKHYPGKTHAEIQAKYQQTYGG
jgi:hypothetical protein